MGMYTEIVAALELRGGHGQSAEAPPQSIIDVLHFLTGYDDSAALDVPDHPFFSRRGWRSVLRTDSYYFPGDTRSTFRYDEIAKSWFLTVRSNLKNYDGEIEQFLDWIAPYTEPNDVRDDGLFFVGYMRYEEDPDPTLIYFDTTTLKPRFFTFSPTVPA